MTVGLCRLYSKTYSGHAPRSSIYPSTSSSQWIIQPGLGTSQAKMLHDLESLRAKGTATPANEVWLPAHSMETGHQDQDRAGRTRPRSLPVVRRAHGRHSTDLARLLPVRLLGRLRVQGRRTAGYDM